MDNLIAQPVTVCYSYTINNAPENDMMDLSNAKRASLHGNIPCDIIRVMRNGVLVQFDGLGMKEGRIVQARVSREEIEMAWCPVWMAKYAKRSSEMT
jgi:hypothetical protein